MLLHGPLKLENGLGCKRIRNDVTRPGMRLGTTNVMSGAQTPRGMEKKQTTVCFLRFRVAEYCLE